MRIEQVDPANAGLVRACHDVLVAASAVDDPGWPAESAERFRLALTEGGRSREPLELWAALDPDTGAVAGWCHIDLPDLDNKDRALVFPLVALDFRRRGIGRSLLRHALLRAKAHGRTVLDGATLTGSAGAAFATAVGATAELPEARRVLDLRSLPDGKAAQLRAVAAAHAAGYRIVRWAGPTPDEHAAGAVALLTAMNDAPRGKSWDHEQWTLDRLRTRFDGWVRVSPVRAYSVAAIHEATGEMAALTQVRVDRSLPTWGHQGLTAVTRPHRGHRLGLLVKAAMLDWLAEAEPALERIGTGNAESNRFMIAVNETLGYELLEPGWTSYELSIGAAVDWCYGG